MVLSEHRFDAIILLQAYYQLAVQFHAHCSRYLRGIGWTELSSVNLPQSRAYDRFPLITYSPLQRVVTSVEEYHIAGPFSLLFASAFAQLACMPGRSHWSDSGMEEGSATSWDQRGG
jgi:hypothetical protein